MSPGFQSALRFGKVAVLCGCFGKRRNTHRIFPVATWSAKTACLDSSSSSKKVRLADDVESRNMETLMRLVNKRDVNSSALEAHVVHKKVVVVGDGYCGKTQLLRIVNNNDFPNLLVPDTYEHAITEVKVDGKQVELQLMDTAGQDGYERSRLYAYKDADAVAICFALDSTASLSNVKEKWLPEVRRYCGDVPIILVGTKAELRPSQVERDLTVYNGTSDTFVRDKEGFKVAMEICADAYVECSANMRVGVQEMIRDAARAALRKKHKRKNALMCFCGFL